MNTQAEKATTVMEDHTISVAMSIIRQRLGAPRALMNAPDLIKNYLTLKLATLPHEQFGMVCLDAKGRFIADHTLFRGTLNHSSVYPREVVKEALHSNANSVVIYHNHPSGSTEPSLSDRSITAQLAQALKVVDIQLNDHIIIAGMEHYSFHEQGEL